MTRGLLWVIWDGASFDVVQQLLQAGDLPALASLSGGRVLPVEPLAPNCQTPPSLASLFTGASITEHRVSGFRIPAAGRQATFVEARSGFEPSAVRRPLIWEELTARGVPIRVSHVPWTGGAGTAAVNAYERLLTKPHLVELPLRGPLDLAGREVLVKELDGVYEVSAARTGEPVAVAPSTALRFAERPLRLGPGVATRLAVLARPDGRRFLVHTGLWEMRAEPAALQESIEASVGAFVGRTLGDFYQVGDLGTRAMEGGEGAAEDALLESARLQVECFTRCAELLVRGGRQEGLAISYLPTLDEIQHEAFRWFGDDQVPRIRQLLRQAYALADQHLASLLPHLGPGWAVAVGSDHGAAQLRRNYHPNQTLARAGLLRFDAHGGIDVRGSRVAYHPAGNGSVWVNRLERAGGVVGPELESSCIAAAEGALRAARDPETGEPAVGVRRVPEGERDLLGDLFLNMRTGYECYWEPGPSGAEFAAARKGGTHITPTGESTLRGMFTIGKGHWPADLAEPASLTDVHAVIERVLGD